MTMEFLTYFEPTHGLVLITYTINIGKLKFLLLWMAHMAVPISVSIALGHMSADAVTATAGG